MHDTSRPSIKKVVGDEVILFEQVRINKSFTQKRKRYVYVSNFRFRASRPSTPLFEKWKILSYYTVKLLF